MDVCVCETTKSVGAKELESRGTSTITGGGRGYYRYLSLVVSITSVQSSTQRTYQKPQILHWYQNSRFDN